MSKDKRKAQRAVRELHIDKHTPKEMGIVFRKINEIIRYLDKRMIFSYLVMVVSGLLAWVLAVLVVNKIRCY